VIGTTRIGPLWRSAATVTNASHAASCAARDREASPAAAHSATAAINESFQIVDIGANTGGNRNTAVAITAARPAVV